MRTALTRTLLAILLFLSCIATGSAQGVTGTCLSNDTYGQRLVSFFQQIVTPANSYQSALTDTLGIASVSSSQVSLVTTASTCDAAAAAVDSIITTKRTNYPIYVISLGPSFGVSFATEGSTAPGFAYVFDSTWHFKGIVKTF